jgi:hypothetical protein
MTLHQLRQTLPPLYWEVYETGEGPYRFRRKIKEMEKSNFEIQWCHPDPDVDMPKDELGPPDRSLNPIQNMKPYHMSGVQVARPMCCELMDSARCI